jgi:pimeloyl-ACP methyl ester carboxylesterase
MNGIDRVSERLTFMEVNGRQIAAAVHDAPRKRLVLMCHGFRGDKLGPNRTFVRLARRLQSAGVGSLRFDQYGSGDSAGDFFDSSFAGWVKTTTTLAQRFLDDDYRVALLGQSVGGTAALIAAAELGERLASAVAWVPDPSVDAPSPEGAFMEEGGQRVRWRYWQEAYQANAASRFSEIVAPTLVFLATDDAYVSPENQQVLLASRQPHQQIVMLEGHTHSGWTYDQAENIIAQTVNFITAQFHTI